VVVVAVAFQSVFHAEMHKNDVFFIFLKLFFRSTHQNDQKNIKKIILKKIKFLKNARVSKRFLSTISFHPNISSRGCWNCVLNGVFLNFEFFLFKINYFLFLNHFNMLI
jgi:hypothetical protein